MATEAVTHAEITPGFLGTRWPNLLVVADSGKGFEFRVQCEVEIKPELARELTTLIMDKARTKEALQRAAELVASQLPKDARRTFKDIIRLGFSGQPEYEP
jgi:hypothetical protein